MVVATAMAVLTVLSGEALAGQASAPKAPSGLTVTQASSSSVALAWVGEGTSFAVERKALGAAWPAATATPSPVVGTATMPMFTDNKVDAMTTYVYRVRTQGAGGVVSAASNEVTVGPPPTGFSQVIATPKAIQDHDTNQFANVIAMALDANGDPAFAYLVNDLNNDGEYPDSVLDFISWNRATYRWNPSVRVATVGEVPRSGSRPAFSLAFDGAARVGLAYLVKDREIHVAFSTDTGRTWASSLVISVPAEAPGLSTPSLALDAGKAYLAYHSADDVTLLSGSATDPPSAWSKQTAPRLPGTTQARAECLSVAVDAEHRPVLTYCLNPTEGYTVTLAFWRAGQPSAVKVLDTQNFQTDDPAATLAVSGSRMAAAFYGARDDKFFSGHHVWMTRSTDQGATWAPAALAADDGGHEMATPVSIAIDSAGRYAMGAPIGGGNEAAVKCGQPSLMRSTDGSAWTTCAPATRGFAATSAPGFALVTFAVNDRIYEVFRTQQPAAGLAAGIVLWREP